MRGLPTVGSRRYIAVVNLSYFELQNGGSGPTFWKNGNAASYRSKRPRMCFVNSGDKVEGIVADEAAAISRGTFEPVNCMSDCLV